jgi:hypothetical protein
MGGDAAGRRVAADRGGRVMPPAVAWTGTRPRVLPHGRLFCLLAGTCDLATGVLLMLDPRSTLVLLGIADPLAVPVHLRLVGAFVAAVGLSYLYPFLTPQSGRRLPVVVEVTALVRAVVATFVTAAVATGAMVPGWLWVAAFDGGLAALQLVLLGRGFFVEGEL